MRLSISNIGWTSEYDEEMYRFLADNDYFGLEIAPTRIFPQAPYDRLDDARNFLKHIKEYNLSVTSIQSIWYGVTDSIFGTDSQRQGLVEYTKKSIDFANVLECPNIVFGCPKNRAIPPHMTPDEYLPISHAFFEAVCAYASQKGVFISIEPNPPIYNTNFINTSKEAFDFCASLRSVDLMVNFDLGAMIYNGEDMNILNKHISEVNHVHLSEPYLAPLTKRDLHKDFILKLHDLSYSKSISIEICTQENIDVIKNAAIYIRELCNDCI